MNKFIQLLKRSPWLTGLIIIATIISGYFYFSRPKQTFSFEIARRTGILQEVSVTGKVKADQNVDLAFEKSGRVAYIPIKVGDKVFQGETLTSLDNADLRAQLDQALANVRSAQAKLDELNKGVRPEEIQVSQIKVMNAGASLEDAKRSFVATLNDSYTKSEDAVRNKVDSFFSNPRGSNPQLAFSLFDSQLQINLQSERLSVENLLNNWNSSLTGLSASSDFSSYASAAGKNLDFIKNFLDKAALAVNSLTPNSSFSQTTIDGYKSNVSTGRTNVNTAISSLSSANSSLTSAKSSLSLAQEELALKKAGSTPEQISAQSATVDGLKAAADSVRAQISKTVIYSPINGVVTKQDAKVGEIASPNASMISLISEAEFQIEAFVPEVDIAKVKLSDTARVTLDAYGEDIFFEAKLIQIDPAETIIEGVATYKITLEFSKEDKRIRSGMTANIDIATDKRDDAIAVPQRTVFIKNDKKFVSILGDGNKIEEREVKVGLKGSDGNVEILEGVREGEKVLISGQIK